MSVLSTDSLPALFIGAASGLINILTSKLFHTFKQYLERLEVTLGLVAMSERKRNLSCRCEIKFKTNILKSSVNALASHAMLIAHLLHVPLCRNMTAHVTIIPLATIAQF